MKIFCIGFQKTGTSSLRDALRRLGYSVSGVFGRDLSLEELRDTYVERGLAIVEKFDAVEDMPWPLMFRELDVRFPDSKFILSVRETDAWFRSIDGHFGETHSVLHQLTYGKDAPCPRGHEARYREVYEAHNRAVREYFADRPRDLLVMDLAAGDGWTELGNFLGRADVPSGPFVHTNSTAQRRSLANRVRVRLARLGLARRLDE